MGNKKKIAVRNKRLRSALGNKKKSTLGDDKTKTSNWKYKEISSGK